MGKCHARVPVQCPPRLSFKPDVRFPNQGGPVLRTHHSTSFFCSYVFDNYTWDKTPGDFSSFNGKPIPARVPLTALLSGTPPSSSLYICVRLINAAPGPIAGDPFPSSAASPPAVIPEFFNEVCPTRTVIDREAFNAPLSGASAATVLQAWVNLLERTEDRCVEVKEYSGQIFDFWCVKSPSLLSESNLIGVKVIW